MDIISQLGSLAPIFVGLSSSEAKADVGSSMIVVELESNVTDLIRGFKPEVGVRWQWSDRREERKEKGPEFIERGAYFETLESDRWR